MNKCMWSASFFVIVNGTLGFFFLELLRFMAKGSFVPLSICFNNGASQLFDKEGKGNGFHIWL